jgi:hypothetical protein
VAEVPDDEHDDEHDFAFELLSEEMRERLQAAFAPMTAELSNRLAKVVAPMAAQMREQWASALSGLDLRPLLPAIELPPGLVQTLKRWREFVPSNWPPNVDVDRMTEALVHHGIPLVWAPRQEVVAEVLAAKTRAERVAALVAHQSEVIQNCRDVLAEVSSPTYDGKVVLAGSALDALDAGHHEASQALAVVVVESAVATAIHKQYDKVRTKVLVDLDAVHISDLRLRAALAPLHRFYTPWEEGKTPGPMPEELSRHVTVHSASPEHFNEGNAVLAVLMASTILRALQELEEIRTTLGDPTWLPK